MVPRLSYWLYWPIRLFLELAVVLMLLGAVTQLERTDTFDFWGLDDIVRLHMLYALPVFWLARWRPWTIWLTGPLWFAALAMLMLLSAAFYNPAPLWLPAFGIIIVAAYRLGKAQHRKHDP